MNLGCFHPYTYHDPLKAHGTRGFILKNFDGDFFFRVYEPKKDGEDRREFNDYKITAYDVKVEIIDEHDHLEFRGKRLDYNKKVLGK